MRIFSFSFLIATAAALGHLYLYMRVVRPLFPERRPRLIAAAVLAVITLLFFLRRTLRDVLPGAVSDGYLVVSYVWLALLTALVLAAVAMDGVAVVLALAQRRKGPAQAADPVALPAIDEGRRTLVKALPLTAVGGGLVTAGYGGWRAMTPPEVTERAVRLARLPRSLDGMTIVQLTDIHVGPFIERRFVEELVRRTNALKPDLVAITGDLVDGSVAQLGGAVAALGGLRARWGSYFVTGNHDYYSGDVEWTAFLERLGLHVLRNRPVAVGDGGGRIDLVGVDDWSGARRRGGGGYDLEKAMTGLHDERAKVLLAHQPANFRAAARRGVDLQISGHTHGGQIFPMTGLIHFAWDHVAGLYEEEESGGQIFVSRGCGFWGPPMRLNAPPEIARLVLTA